MFILILILGSGLAFITVFTTRNLMTPRKISSIEALLKQKKISAAIKLAKQLAAKKPRNSCIHYLLGKAYLADEKPKLALEEFKEVNNIGNFSSCCPEEVFRKSMAAIFFRFGHLEEALKEYLLLVKLEPHKAEHYYQAGLLFEARNNTEKAHQYYRKTVELDDRHSEAHFKLGSILYRHKLPGEAKKELEKALLFNPDNYKAYYVVGKILEDNNEFLTALHAFEKAQKDPAYKAKSLLERGKCYISTGDPDMGLNELERALSNSKRKSGAEILQIRYWLAHCYEKTHVIEKALDQWLKIHAMQPSFKDVKEKLRQYQGALTDDSIKDYLTCSKDVFRYIAIKVVENMGLSIKNEEDFPSGFQILGLEESRGWLGNKQIPKLFWFLRISEMVSEDTIRLFHDAMQKLNASRGLVFASSSFSSQAINFAETRPIDLFGREKLQTILKEIDPPNS